MKILYKNYTIIPCGSYAIKREPDGLFVGFVATLLEAYQTIDYLAQSELIPDEEDDF